MAKREDTVAKDKEEKKDAAKAELTPEEAAAKGKKKKLLVMIIGGVLLCAGLGGGLFFFLAGGSKAEAKKGEGHDEVKAEEPGEKKEEGHGEKKEEGHGEKKEEGHGEKKEEGHGEKKEEAKGEKKEEGHGEKKEEAKGEKKPDAKKGDAKPTSVEGVDFGCTYNFTPFHLNLGNPLENRYIRLEIAVEHKCSEEIKAELDLRKSQLRDAIIAVASRNTREFLLGPDGKEQLRKEVETRINHYMTRKIDNVFITDILIE